MLGDKIRACRKEFKMTQYELAGILGISTRSLINYEQGTRYPKPAVIYQLASVFNKPTDYFLAGGVSGESFSNPAARNKAKILLAAVSGLFNSKDLNEKDRDIFFKEIAAVYFKSKNIDDLKI